MGCGSSVVYPEVKTLNLTSTILHWAAGNGIRPSFSDSYSVREVIGLGTFAVVRRATHRITKTAFAVKSYPVAQPKNEVITSALREINLLRKLKHPCLTELREAFTERDFIHIVLHFLAGEQLNSAVRNGNSLSLDATRCVLYRVLSGLQYMHSEGYVHRDVKPANIVLAVPGDFATAVIVDVGMAERWLDASGRNTRAKLAGTRGYMPPEAFTEASASAQREATLRPEGDLWAAGALAYELLTGTLFPYDLVIESGRTAWFPGGRGGAPDDVSVRRVVEGLLAVDFKKRMTAERALRSTWIAGIIADSVEDIHT